MRQRRPMSIVNGCVWEVNSINTYTSKMEYSFCGMEALAHRVSYITYVGWEEGLLLQVWL